MSTWPEAVALASAGERSVATRGDAPFPVFEAPDGTVTRWMSAEFDSVVARTATALARHDVGPCASVHLALTNCPTFVAVWLVANRLVPVAFVVPADPADPPAPDDLLTWCTARLGMADVPRDITLLDELPRTGVGQIRKFLSKEEVRA